MTCVQGSSIRKYGVAFLVGLPFISSHLWLKAGQDLLQLACPSVLQDTHLSCASGLQLAVLCCPMQVPHVKVLHAVVGQMIPPLAFQTVGGLLLALFSRNPFLADQQAVGEDLVGDFVGRGDKDDMATHLLMGPSVWGLDPMRTQEGACR